MTPLLIGEIAQLIAAGGPIAMQLFLKLDGSLNLTPDEKTNIANAIAAANKNDQEVHSLVAGWAAKNGLVMQFALPPAPPAA